MPFVPLRPLALAPLSDEAASIVLAKYFGDVVKAAKELGVDRKDLRRLTWHNPRILNAAHERMELFHIGVKSKILEAVYSRSAKKQRWGVDALCESYEFRDNPFAKALAPAPASRRVTKVAEPDYARRRRLRLNASSSELLSLTTTADESERVRRLNLFERRGLVVGAMSTRLAKNHRQRLNHRSNQCLQNPNCPSGLGSILLPR
jgi:hypothetical protein